MKKIRLHKPEFACWYWGNGLPWYQFSFGISLKLVHIQLIVLFWTIDFCWGEFYYRSHSEG